MARLAIRPQRLSVLVVTALVAAGLGSATTAPAARADSETFSYVAPTDETPDPVQTFVVPDGVYAVQVNAEGGDGGGVMDANSDWAVGVKGAAVSTLLEVAPGDELQIRVGGVGGLWGVDTPGPGGWNGGGAGGGGSSGGGGASDVRVGGNALVDRVVVAGGGGGAARYSAPGGVGGTPDGVDGSADVTADDPDACEMAGGGGGTTSAAGGGGWDGVVPQPCADLDVLNDYDYGWAAGAPGALGVGGASGSEYGGGGGGGYYGGGAGAGARDNGWGAGGGGGSSYVPGDPNGEQTDYTIKGAGSQPDGRVTITYADPATVTFHGNGGSGSMPDQLANVPMDLAANTFSRPGYTFAGWNTGPSGVGTSYTDGAEYAFEASVTLYAQWTALPNYTVTFDANGGSGSMPDQAANVPSDLDANIFTRPGYSFERWSTEAEGSGTSYDDGAEYAFDASVTLYAQWAVAPDQTVTFDGNGGWGWMPTQLANVPAALDTNTFTREGYAFTGWNTQSDGSGSVSYADEEEFPFTASVTLYAQWEVLPDHTVTFEANGGSGTMAPQVSNTPASLTTNAFTRAGHYFTTWNTEPDGSGTPYYDIAVYPFDASLTLYAQWEAELAPPGSTPPAETTPPDPPATSTPAPTPTPTPTLTPTPTASPEPCAAGCPGADLRGIDLTGNDLSGRDLRGTDLRGASLKVANLRGANLRGANLAGATLRGANLDGADLRKADLRKAKLNGASLIRTRLQLAKLQKANLKKATLKKADVRKANFTGAKLVGAKLQGMRSTGAKGLSYRGRAPGN